MTYVRQALSRKVSVKEGGIIREVPVREAIALNTTNLALKGDLKMIALVLDLDREIMADREREVEREEIEDSKNMTAKEKMELFQRMVRDASYGPRPRGKK
jgi:hypothetical protein